MCHVVFPMDQFNMRNKMVSIYIVAQVRVRLHYNCNVAHLVSCKPVWDRDMYVHDRFIKYTNLLLTDTLWVICSMPQVYKQRELH